MPPAENRAELSKISQQIGAEVRCVLCGAQVNDEDVKADELPICKFCEDRMDD